MLRVSQPNFTEYDIIGFDGLNKHLSIGVDATFSWDSVSHHHPNEVKLDSCYLFRDEKFERRNVESNDAQLSP